MTSDRERGARAAGHGVTFRVHVVRDDSHDRLDSPNQRIGDSAHWRVPDRSGSPARDLLTRGESLGAARPAAVATAQFGASTGAGYKGNAAASARTSSRTRSVTAGSSGEARAVSISSAIWRISASLIPRVV